MSVRVARWVPPVSLVLSGAGALAAGYLTVEHYNSSTTLACPESTTINCLKVTTSHYSELLGVPLAVLGLVFFLAMLVLSVPPLWHTGGFTGRWLRRARLVSVIVGAAFVLYLVWAELFPIGAVCLWCTGVHALTLALFGVVAVGTATIQEEEPAHEQ